MLGSLISAGIGLLGSGSKGGGGGADSGAGDQALKDLARHTQFESWQAMTAEAKEKIEPAASAKERGEYLMRMLQAIQNNETEDASAMDSIAANLMRDMQAGTGRIQEEPVVQPLSTESPKGGALSQQERVDMFSKMFSPSASYQQVIEEPTEEEEKERSSFVNLPESFF